MSHVVSSQPSATSPYQPTALQETGSEKNDLPRIHGPPSDNGQDDCCIHTRNRTGICYVFCKLLSLCCQGIKNCTESCCDSCANCLNDCCEDKPRDRNGRNLNTRYTNNSSDTNNFYDNNTCYDDDNTWGINSLSAQHMHVGVGDSTHRPSDSDTRNNSEICHNSGKHHNSLHGDDTTTQCPSDFGSGTHHSSNHDSSTHHTSSHDSGGGGGDSGGGCDSGGGGDSGGGCDSGGGGDDGGGGECDD